MITTMVLAAAWMAVAIYTLALIRFGYSIIRSFRDER